MRIGERILKPAIFFLWCDTKSCYIGLKRFFVIGGRYEIIDSKDFSFVMDMFGVWWTDRYSAEHIHRLQRSAKGGNKRLPFVWVWAERCYHLRRFLAYDAHFSPFGRGGTSGLAAFGNNAPNIGDPSGHMEKEEASPPYEKKPSFTDLSQMQQEVSNIVSELEKNNNLPQERRRTIATKLDDLKQSLLHFYTSTLHDLREPLKHWHDCTLSFLEDQKKAMQEHGKTSNFMLSTFMHRFMKLSDDIEKLFKQYDNKTLTKEWKETQARI